MKIKFILALVATLSLISCNQKAKDKTVEQKELGTEQQRYLIMGDSIASNAQTLLLSKVSEQIKQNGLVGALDYCNENAILLTDSLSDVFSKKIQRLTDKTRNPNNAIIDAIDQKAWEEIKKLMIDTNTEKQLILSDNSEVFYYKAIPIGMPTCLMCHGNKQTDIALKTLEAISKRYPNDQATGYVIGDLRGMWKIKIE